MQARKQQLVLSTMSAHVLMALALMSGAAQAQIATPPAEELAPESTSALDAEAIKSRVVITGSNAANRAPVQA